VRDDTRIVERVRASSRDLTRILVPLDGSPLAETALPLAQALARDHEADIMLLRTVTIEGSLAVQTHEGHEAESYLDSVAGTITGPGRPGVRCRVWYGEADQTIVNAAVEDDIGLIVMSTQGRRGLDRVRFGSVAESVVRKAPVPVLLVRGPMTTRPGGLNRILVALDGSDLSASILPVVERLAGPFDLTVELFHAIEPISATAIPVVGTRRPSPPSRWRRSGATSAEWPAPSRRRGSGCAARCGRGHRPKRSSGVPGAATSV